MFGKHKGFYPSDFKVLVRRRAEPIRSLNHQQRSLLSFAIFFFSININNGQKGSFCDVEEGKKVKKYVFATEKVSKHHTSF